jgi:hypothetical protein
VHQAREKEKESNKKVVDKEKEIMMHADQAHKLEVNTLYKLKALGIKIKVPGLYHQTN